MARHRPILDSPLKWIGAITAVLSLVLGLNQVTKVFSEVRDRQRQVAELSAVASEQQRAGDYPAAWRSLEQALNAADQGGYLAKLTGQLGAERQALREAQESLAMTWLENIRVPEGKKLSDVVDPLVPVVTRGVLTANGVRKGDLLGHLGWAYFLKSRDGGGDVNPEQYYQQSLTADPGNPYAHAHWGHWILWKRGNVADATAHFSAALAANRQRPYVRRIQLAALRDSTSTSTDAAFLRTVHDMVEHNETVDARTRHDVYSAYYSAFTAADGFERLIAALPAVSHIALIRALLFDTDFDESSIPLRDACIATLQELGGFRNEALATWRTVRKALPAHAAGRVVDRANAAIARLSRPVAS